MSGSGAALARDQSKRVFKQSVGREADGRSYVLSDATRDRMGDIIEPAGWQLAWFKRNPIALFAHRSDFPLGLWQNIRVEGARLVADLAPAQRGTSARIDEILSLIEQNILRATSVGFWPIRSEPIDPDKPSRGLHFFEQELLEASIVGVPANPAALEVAKSLNISDEVMSLAFGETAETRPGGVALLGKSADRSPAPATRASSRTTAMSISQQIENLHTRLNAARDGLTEYLASETQELVQRDAMSAHIESLTTELTSLEAAERALAPRGPAGQATPVTGAPAVLRRPLGVNPVVHHDPAMPMWRSIGCQLHAYVQRRSVEDVLRERYPDDEASHEVVKAAVAGASTTLATWAAELVQTSTTAMLVPNDPRRILPTLSGLGTALNFGPNAGIIRIPSEAATPSIAGSFVGEAQPIPVRRMGFGAITLSPHKVGVITRYSREIAQYSNPSLEGLVRNAIVRKTGLMLDTLLIDATAGTTVRPAGLIAGVAAITATAGGGYAAILGDLKKLTAPFYAANAGTRLVMLINPAQALDMMMAPGPGNAGFGWLNQFTDRLTIIESTVVPAGNVYMIEAEDFVSVIGVPEFEISEEATLHIEDTSPAHISATGTPNVVAAPVESMFQTNQLALRLIMTVTWAMRRTGMVQWMTGVNWA